MKHLTYARRIMLRTIAKRHLGRQTRVARASVLSPERANPLLLSLVLITVILCARSTVASEQAPSRSAGLTSCNLTRAGNSDCAPPSLGSSLLPRSTKTDRAVFGEKTELTSRTSDGNPVNDGATGSIVPAIRLTLSASPTRLNFGNVTVGASDPQTITLTSTGTRAVTVTEAAVAGTGFSISGLSLPLTLAAGQAADFNVTFTPTLPGRTTGSISVVSTATNSPATVSLSGTGVAPTLLLSATPSSISFGSVTVGGNSSQNVTLTNTGTGSVTVSQATATGAGFSIGGLSLPLTLTAGQSTNFTATFAPTVAGGASGSLSVVSTATNSPATVSLSGTAIAPTVSLSPSSVAFGNQSVGTTSAAQTVTLTNTGNATLTITSVTVTGTNATDFAQTNTCGSSVAAGGNCTISVTFTPSASGSRAASLTITDNASGSPQSVSLSGTGVNSSSPYVALSWLPSSSQNVVGYNAYRGTVSGGPYSTLNSSLVTTTAYTDSTVQSGYTYYYVTTAVDANSHESAYSNEAQAVVGSSGGTAQISENPTSSDFGNIVLGSNSILPVILTNTGTSSLTISQATVTGAGFSISGLPLPLTLAAGNNTGFSVTFAPTAAGSVSGNVSIVSNATNSPTVELLSGAGIHAVSLAWNASTSQVAGYNVYRGTVSGGPYTKLNSLLVSGLVYTDTNVQAGTTYYYVATAVDSGSHESAYSNQSQAAVPSP